MDPLGVFTTDVESIPLPGVSEDPDGIGDGGVAGAPTRAGGSPIVPLDGKVAGSGEVEGWEMVWAGESTR